MLTTSVCVISFNHLNQIVSLWSSDLYRVKVRHKYLPVNNPFLLEKAMAPHSSTLAWKIPWMEEPGRLQSMGSLGVGHD